MNHSAGKAIDPVSQESVKWRRGFIRQPRRKLRPFPRVKAPGNVQVGNPTNYLVSLGERPKDFLALPLWGMRVVFKPGKANYPYPSALRRAIWHETSQVGHRGGYNPHYPHTRVWRVVTDTGVRYRRTPAGQSGGGLCR